MKNSIRSVSIVALLMVGGFQAFGDDGGQSGGGGGAWVCRETSGALRWVRSVDLFEAENELDVRLANYTGTYEQIVTQVQTKLTSTNRQLSRALTPFLNSINNLHEDPPRIVYTDATLEVINDAHYKVRPSPSECAGGQLVQDPKTGELEIPYEQLVNYVDDQHIEIQKQLWQKLDAINQAALVWHETIYRYMRFTAEATDSVRSRQVNGIAFSNLSNFDAAGRIQQIYGGDPISKEGGGNIFSLKPGLYVDKSDFGGQECAVQILPDPSQKRFTAFSVRITPTSNCNPVDSLDSIDMQCPNGGDDPNCNFVRANSRDSLTLVPSYGTGARDDYYDLAMGTKYFGSFGHVMQWQAPAHPSRYFEIGRPYSIGDKASLTVLARLPGGAWKVSYSDQDMPSGYQQMVINLDQNPATNVWFGEVNIPTPVWASKTICSAAPFRLQVTFDVDGNEMATVETLRAKYSEVYGDQRDCGFRIEHLQTSTNLQL